MHLRSRALLGLVALSGLLVACSDATSPPARPTAAAPLLSKSSSSSSSSSTKPDTSRAPTPTPTPTPGGGGGGSSSGACGVLSTNIQTYNIVVYTTRIGIGFSGTATNCGGKKVSFEVDIVDTDPNPACTVDVPHFIAAKNTDPGLTVTWAANSTLVPCQGATHTFDVRLWDTKSGQTLATTTVSAFL